MRLIILSGILAVALPFAIALFATKDRVGLDVSERFLERLDEIPSGATEQQRKLTPDNLKAWVADHPTSAAQYALRVVPMDVVYLLALGAFLGLASNWLATDMQWPASVAGIPMWMILWLLPALYVATDLIEDSMIAMLLTFPDFIGAATVGALKAAKAIKIVSVGAGISLTVALGIMGCFWGKSA
jgi:hypothetical protein